MVIWPYKVQRMIVNRDERFEPKPTVSISHDGVDFGSLVKVMER